MDKAVILAAGRGSRMRRTTDAMALTSSQVEMARTGLKAMMPVGRPFIDYVMAGLADAGYRRVCLVIGPEHQALRDHCCGFSGGRLEIDFATQHVALGTATAVATAFSFVGDDPFLLINSDNYYPSTALAGLRSLNGAAVAAFTPQGLSTGNISPDRLRNFAVLSENPDGTLERVIEKPSDVYLSKTRKPVLIGMNCWRFTPVIFAACRAVPMSARGEYELTDAVSYTIEKLDERFAILIVNEPVLDLSTQADVPEVTRRLASVEVRL